MKKEEIYLGDLKRILIGDAPPEFLLEILLRTLLVCLAVMIVVRLLGKRMSDRLPLVETALLVMLGIEVCRRCGHQRGGGKCSNGGNDTWQRALRDRGR